jgi:hypothetical protein
LKIKHPFVVIPVLARLGLATIAQAGDHSSFRRSDLGGTEPGSWARHEQESVDQKGRETVSVQTVSSLENDGDGIGSRLLETGTAAKSRITGPVKKSEVPKLPFWQAHKRAVPGRLAYNSSP